VTLPQLAEANDIIGHAILGAGARAVNAVPYVPPISPGSANSLSVSEKQTGIRNRYPLEVMGQQIMVESPLVGRHQLRNLALAIAAAEELHKQGIAQITPETIAEGIRQTRWPGRFQVIPATEGNPEYVLDVAHNPAGAWALRSTLSAYDESETGREITMIFGAMRDKAIREVGEILFPIASHVILTSANNPRAATPEEIREATARVATSTNLQEVEDVAKALAKAKSLAGSNGLVVITGSIYIVGEAMRILGIRI